MPRSLEAFLHRQDAPALAAVLLELAVGHEAVEQRPEHLQLANRPHKLVGSVAALPLRAGGWAAVRYDRVSRTTAGHSRAQHRG
jgi:hypothetical protein